MADLTSNGLIKILNITPTQAGFAGMRSLRLTVQPSQSISTANYSATLRDTTRLSSQPFANISNAVFSNTLRNNTTLSTLPNGNIIVETFVSITSDRKSNSVRIDRDIKLDVVNTVTNKKIGWT